MCTIIRRAFSTTACIGAKTMKLFTPGPVNTTYAVKKTMLYDLGLSQQRAKQNMKFLRANILKIACDTLNPKRYTVIPLQGCGTFLAEAVLSLATPRKGGKALVLQNGYFGEILTNICDKMRLPFDSLVFPLGSPVDAERVERHLLQHRDYTALAMVHHETSSGVMNSLEDIAALRIKYMPSCTFIVDAVSSFGCYEVDMDLLDISYLIVTPNKCLESVPGCGFVIADKDVLLKSTDNIRSYVFDLIDEYEELEETNVMRFTHPTNAFLACEQAVREYFRETRKQRNRRYKLHHKIIRDGMKKLGFRSLVPSNINTSFVLNAFLWPAHPQFDFGTFQRYLEKKGLFVYPDSLTNPNKVFRIGNIGQLNPTDCRRLLAKSQKIIRRMKIPIPMPTELKYIPSKMETTLI